MTWTHTINDSGELEVYDHAGSLVTTIPNDGTGFRLPSDILDVMHDECAARGWDLSDPWVAQTLKDAAFERVSAE